MGVVAPVSGVGAALVPVAVGVLAGERPAALVWVGILARPARHLAGVARARRSGRRSGPGSPTASWPGSASEPCSRRSRRSPTSAGFLPLALNQVVAGVAIIAVAIALRAPWVPREPRALAGVVSGALGALATGAFLVATQSGYLTVTAVIASLYPAFTVLLAATVLREHVHRAQAMGLGLCAVAVALVAAG